MTQKWLISSPFFLDKQKWLISSPIAIIFSILIFLKDSSYIAKFSMVITTVFIKFKCQRWVGNHAHVVVRSQYSCISGTIESEIDPRSLRGAWFQGPSFPCKLKGVNSLGEKREKEKGKTTCVMCTGYFPKTHIHEVEEKQQLSSLIPPTFMIQQPGSTRPHVLNCI